jgi:hypothetical protein
MVLKAFNLVFGLAFLLAIAVQFNDPDAAAWVLTYAGALAACVAFHLGRLPWKAGAGFAFVCLVWAATLLPVVIAHPPPLSEVFGDVKMYAPGVEEARELGGLCVVAGWLCVLSVTVRARG